jgi:hypothetical protein
MTKTGIIKNHRVHLKLPVPLHVTTDIVIDTYNNRANYLRLAKKPFGTKTAQVLPVYKTEKDKGARPFSSCKLATHSFIKDGAMHNQQVNQARDHIWRGDSSILAYLLLLYAQSDKGRWPVHNKLVFDFFWAGNKKCSKHVDSPLYPDNSRAGPLTQGLVAALTGFSNRRKVAMAKKLGKRQTNIEIKAYVDIINN